MRYKDIYFIGIGGIGMSAIARYYNAHEGCRVSGYDRTPSELTAALESEGIAIHYKDDCSFIPKDVENTLVVYTPAIPADMGELVYVMEHGYKVVKRSRMLGEIAAGKDCLAVAGTHGKTTTSTLLAHILTGSEQGCSAFLGGISKNYDSNLLINTSSAAVVAEADEFDRSFLQLHPRIAAITAMDADHLDIYSDLGHVREAFRQFASQVSGTVILKAGLSFPDGPDISARVLTYAYDDPGADFHAENLKCDDCGYFTFDLRYPEGTLRDCTVGIPGWVNVENAVAASAIALCYGVDPEKVRSALATFHGVKRRFDIHLNTPSCTYIDDYAHHPAELAAAIGSIRNMFPQRRLTAVFQPHLYTRTRDFAEDFAASLSKVDRLLLMDIYPAREEPIPGVTSEIIFDGVEGPEKAMVSKDGLLGALEEWLFEETPVDISRRGDVLVTFGAGDIDRFTGPITEMLRRRLAADGKL